LNQNPLNGRKPNVYWTVNVRLSSHKQLIRAELSSQTLNMLIKLGLNETGIYQMGVF